MPYNLLLYTVQLVEFQGETSEIPQTTGIHRLISLS